MSTGISMSSVNKIKELADNGDYSLALDILEHQDLSKSLSPQFIRICGEVYYENKRYPEARAALVKAHAMANIFFDKTVFIHGIYTACRALF